MLEVTRRCERDGIAMAIGNGNNDIEFHVAAPGLGGRRSFRVDALNVARHYSDTYPTRVDHRPGQMLSTGYCIRTDGRITQQHVACDARTRARTAYWVDRVDSRTCACEASRLCMPHPQGHTSLNLNESRSHGDGGQHMYMGD